jgi:acetylornithine deacetylase/succinyl-diaminopimelate desuccinylase-like protein
MTIVDASRFDVEQFHEQAVRTASHDGVDEMRALLCRTLRAHDIDPHIDTGGNVRATRGNSNPDTHLVLNTHIDTVPPHVPYEREGDIVRGRGACDAKGSLAALLAAFLACEPKEGQVTLAITPDEEVLSTGAAHLAFGPDSLNVDGYIVGEPTGLDVCVAAKGRFEGTVTVDGVAAHAAEPNSGVNAVGALESVLRAIGSFNAEYGPERHPSLGGPVLTPTLVDGGEASNQVPAECRLTLDRRSVPPETAEGFQTSLLDHLQTAAPSGVTVGFDLTDRPTPFLEAFATETDMPLVEQLCTAAAASSRPFTAATEASYFAADAPTVVFGPGVLADKKGPVAHAEREYIHLSEIHTAAEAVTVTLDSLLS